MTPDAAAGQFDPSITLALLIAADADAGPAAAWALARAAATSRRVALIDLTIGEGVLDAGDVSTGGPEGIVDVFEFGASWGHVARALDGSLHYVPAGTPAPDPRVIWGHTRWDRLKRGFATEGALLLLYIPPRALADLGPRADLLVLLGAGPSASTVRAFAAGRDLPLLGPVHLPAPEGEPATATPPEPPPPPGTGRWVPWAVGLAVAVVVFAVAFVVLRAREGPLPPPMVGPAAPSTDTVLAPAPAPAVETPAAAVRPTGDTLYYSVQVAAFNQLEQATAFSAGLERADWLVAVTPVRLGRQSVLWYRVLVGAYGSPGAADTARRRLRAEGRLGRGEGTVVRTPHTWALAPEDADPASTLRGLRQRGIPAYIVPGSGEVSLFLGAFETPEQAAAAESLLARSGQPHTLVTRRGITP